MTQTELTEPTKEGLKRGYEVTIKASDIDSRVVEKLEQSRAQIQVKGFRKGQAPISLLKKMYGKSVMGEAMQETIDAIMKEHFVATGDKPVNQPDIKMSNEDWKEGDDISLTLNYEKLPEIPNTDFSKIKLTRFVVDVDEGSIKESLKTLSETSNNFETRKKGTEKLKDQVVIDFDGKVGGKSFEGGKAESYPLVLGSNSFIPGFEDQLINAKKGQKLAVNVTFPKNYGSEELAGKDAVFSVEIISVNEPKPAKIDDDFAKKFGVDDVSKLKEQIKERLGSEFIMASKTILKKDLMDKLNKIVKFELPPSLVETEAKQIAHELWHEKNPEVKGHDHGPVEPNKEHKKIAERRVKLGLFLSDL